VRKAIHFIIERFADNPDDDGDWFCADQGSGRRFVGRFNRRLRPLRKTCLAEDERRHKIKASIKNKGAASLKWSSTLVQLMSSFD